MVAVLASLGPIVAFFSVSTTSYPFMLLFNVVVCSVSGALGLSFLLQTLHRLSILDSQPSRCQPPRIAARRLSSESTSWIRSRPGTRQRGPGTASRPARSIPCENRVLGKHVKTVFNLWVIVFALVGAQMGWVLRPFIGNPDLPFTWFRGRESNFFQAVLHTFQSLFS